MSKIIIHYFFQGVIFKVLTGNEFILSERRKLIQGSKFLYRQTEKINQCLSRDIDHSDNLTIIHIPKKIKIEIIKWLIEKNEMAYDLYAGKNIIDYYSVILKSKFNDINDSNMDEYIGKDDFWKS